MLKCSEISFGFGERTLFSDVNLILNPGDSLAITGPSGSGKTSLLQIIGQLRQPRSGSVQHGEHKVAWVRQSLEGLDHRSVLDNIRAFHRIDKGEIDRDSEDRLLGRLDLTALGGLSYRVLSGGEKQRVCVARALVSSRQILLADEPTNQLDSARANSVAAELNTSASAGRIVVVVTHDLAVASQFDKVARLDEAGLWIDE